MTELDRALSGKPEDYINDPSLEAAWAIKCYENARTHMSLICSCDSSLLKLSNCDDELYIKFRAIFPDFDVSNLEENALKSESAKHKWRQFIDGCSSLIDDYNDGYLVRLDSRGNYDSINTILVVKAQFLVIEIARNKEGHNKYVRQNYKASDIPPE